MTATKDKFPCYDYLDEIDRDIKSEEDLNKDMAIEKYKTALRKAQFINQINGGLGEVMAVDPRRVKIIKKPPMQKLKTFLIKLFTKL